MAIPPAQPEIWTRVVDFCMQTPKETLEELLAAYPAVSPTDILRLAQAGQELARDPEFQKDFEEAMAEEARLAAAHSD